MVVKRMNTLVKKLFAALLLAAVALMLLQVRYVRSEEQTSADQALAFIKDVARIDVAKYKMTVRGPSVMYLPNRGGAKTEDFKYTLESAGSNFEAVITFVNGTFAYCKFYFYEGYPIYAQTAPPVLDYAEGILERFQNVSGKNYPAEMENMLNSVNPASPNTTLESSSMKFSVSLQENTGSIRWVYMANGFEYTRKKVDMTFVNGHLESFSNYWNVWIAGDTVPVVTREEAIEKALEWASSYELLFDGVPVPFTIATDRIDAQMWTTPREPLTLQLSWHVYLYFEKWVHSVYGLEVGLWADTGEIHSFGQLATAGLPPTQTPTPAPPDATPTPSDAAPTPAPSPLHVAAFAGAAAVIVIVAAFLVAKRRRK